MIKTSQDFLLGMIFKKLQGISSQTVESNLALREGRTDISDILWHFFSRNHMPNLICNLTFYKKKEMENYEKSQKLLKN